MLVRVVFNEAVSLPGTKPENSFTIKNDATQSALEVKAASLDPNDSEGKTVMLSTGIQKAGATYVLTAQITIKDLAGNPVVSGTSDTAVFTGSDLNPNAMINTQQGQTQSPAAASAGPTITDVKALDATHVQITFSKSVKIGKTPADQFVMTEEQNTENVLNVSKAEISVNGKVVTLTTDPQKNMGYNLIVLDLKGTDGSAVDPNNNATTFNGVGAASQVGADNGTQAAVDTQSMTQQTQDITPPEDATNFMAALLGKVGVHLTWTGSINSAKDLKNYMLYIHKDGDAYDKGKLVDMKKSAFDVKSLVPGATYFFKLTAKDKVGNESQGIETQFTLPETGPELIFLFAGSLGAGKFFSGKKKNKK